MSFHVRAALVAVSLFGGALTVPGLIGPGAVTASSVDAATESLVPQSVLEAALIEERARDAGLLVPAPEAQSILPEEPDSATTPVFSLSALVDRHSGSQTVDREHECLAGAVYFEAKSESLEGQLAVAEVILNRAASGRFASSACGVVFQPSQFSFVRGGGFPPIARSSRQWRTAVAIATIARQELAESGVGSALFFHARHVSPGWKLRRVAAVGNHIFYR